MKAITTTPVARVLFGLLLCSSAVACSDSAAAEFDALSEADVTAASRQAVASISDMMTVAYNADGTIGTAELDGDTYRFFYFGGGVPVRVERISPDGSQTWAAGGFKFNSDGYLTHYTESITDSDADVTSSTEAAYTFGYTSTGRLASITLDATSRELDADGAVVTESGRASIAFSWNGDNLSAATLSDSEGPIDTWTYDYSAGAANTHSLFTPHFLDPVEEASPLAAIFAAAGYLGEAPAALPSVMTHTFTDYDNPDESGTMSLPLCYHTDSNGRVTSVTSTLCGQNWTSDIAYVAL